jgi:hypothetical protein
MSDENEVNPFREMASSIVDSVLAEKPADVSKAVADALTGITYDMVSDLRAQVEKDMYAPQVEETVDVEVDGEVYEINADEAAEILRDDKEFQESLAALPLIQKINENDEDFELSEEEKDELSGQLDELSKKTLGSYVKKASDSTAQHHALRVKAAADRESMHRAASDLSHNNGPAARKVMGDWSSKAATVFNDKEEHHFRKARKRLGGIDRAVDRLTK